MAELKGTISKIFDDRAMSVDGTRIGAGYKQTLAQQTTGGDLVEGAVVVVQYTAKGKWNNADSIQVVGGAAPAAQASSGPAVDAASREKGGRHTRSQPNNYRDPDELTRLEILPVAANLLIATGEVSTTDKTEWLPKLLGLTDLLVAYSEDTVDTAFITNQLQGHQSKTPEPKQEAAPEPTQEAAAAAEAASKPGPADGADPLAAFIGA